MPLLLKPWGLQPVLLLLLLLKFLYMIVQWLVWAFGFQLRSVCLLSLFLSLQSFLWLLHLLLLLRLHALVLVFPFSLQHVSLLLLFLAYCCMLRGTSRASSRKKSLFSKHTQLAHANMVPHAPALALCVQSSACK
jgi:hypothetical protein